MNAKFGMILGMNLAVASVFMQGCKATKPHGGDQPPPPPPPSVDTPLPPPTKTALENDIETTRYEEPKKPEVAPPVLPPPPRHTTTVKPLPPPPPDVVPPAKPDTDFTVYVVQRGDTFSQICEKRGVRMSEALKLNPSLSGNPNRILVGSKIKLPAAGATPAPAKEPATTAAKVNKFPPPKLPPPPEAKKADDKKTEAKPKGDAANVKAPATKKTAYKPYDGPTKEYVVKSGDQLGKISHSSGITVRALKELNGLASNDLKIGQKLKVPAEKVKPEEEKKDAPVASDTAKKDDKSAAATEKTDDKPVVEPAKKDDGTQPATADKKDENKPAEPEKKSASAETASDDAAAAKADGVAVSQKPYETYVVKEGEDIVSIAINFGVSPSALMDLNDLKASDVVVKDQVIKIPVGSKAQ